MTNVFDALPQRRHRPAGRHRTAQAGAVRWAQHAQPVTGARTCALDPSSGAALTTGDPGETLLKRRGGPLGCCKTIEATAETLRRLLKDET